MSQRLEDNAVERAFEEKRRRFGEDRCDLIGPVLNEGGSAGDSVTLTTLLRGVDCFVEEISGADAQTVIGGQAFVSSHSVQMKCTPGTLAITPQYKIKVYRRGKIAERIFEKPVQTAQSFSPLVTVKASFVHEGFSQ